MMTSEQWQMLRMAPPLDYGCEVREAFSRAATVVRTDTNDDDPCRAICWARTDEQNSFIFAANSYHAFAEVVPVGDNALTPEVGTYWLLAPESLSSIIERPSTIEQAYPNLLKVFEACASGDVCWKGDVNIADLVQSLNGLASIASADEGFTGEGVRLTGGTTLQLDAGLPHLRGSAEIEVENVAPASVGGAVWIARHWLHAFLEQVSITQGSELSITVEMRGHLEPLFIRGANWHYWLMPRRWDTQEAAFSGSTEEDETS